ncbi:hypothetical protein B1992_01325 [Pseudoxanthomonas broegbernensis]|uniref:Cytochrome C n=1 Tax=Pseudoxanthomonas broegbernensis TaxID=83619 RepID=A0A7V8GQ72_9GAMM|nr:cytochrome c [Pseudoxanthomonas broegbernensis]KAF1688093.1 hypothetical protein B1992_01325 [Pseudoxanthomonas broegbernensis]MBB6065131.1 cytochrome c556 [Pseudoxanthomonas broegbernensis]
MASQETRRPSSAARYLFVLLAGLVIGAICTVMLVRALKARSDPFPEALMQVMARQDRELRANVAANRCTANDALPRLQSLRAMANDVETAFPGLRDDQRFAAAASGLRATLDATLAAPPQDCAQLTAAVARIGEDCKACHRDFR